MKNKTTLILQIILIIAMFWTGLYFWNDLPDLIPTHWDINWEIDNYSSKTFWVLFLPILALIISILFKVLPKVDPKHKNYKHFQKSWNQMQLYIILFFAYLYFIIITFSLWQEIKISKFVVWWIWILFILLWNLFWKIRQNYFIWIKLPWTLNNEKNWNKTHRFWWYCFVIWWVILFISALLNYINFYLIILFILVSTILPVIYSYLFFKKKK